MSRFKLLYFVIFVIKLYHVNAQISDKRLCGDEECKEPIAYAKTLLRYSSPDFRILSFGPNEDVVIYSKSAGSRMDLWGGEIKGKRGYIPKNLVRETKIIKKDLTFTVKTEDDGKDEVKIEVPSDEVQADKVQEAFEVVDGTTIYLNPQDSITPSSTESPLQSTTIPVTVKEAAEPSSSNDQNGAKSTENLEQDSNSSKTDQEDADDDEDDDDYDLEDDDDQEEDLSEDLNNKSNENPIFEESSAKTQETPPSNTLPLDQQSPISEEKIETSKIIPITLEINGTNAEEPLEPVENVPIEKVQLPLQEEPKIVESPPEFHNQTLPEAPPSEEENVKVPPPVVNKVEPETISSPVVSEEISNVEVTTLAPELEEALPQLNDPGVDDVTPNPVEVSPSTVPPFGLFNFNTNEALSSQSEGDHKIEDVSSENITESEDLSQKITTPVSEASVSAENEVSSEEPFQNISGSEEIETSSAEPLLDISQGAEIEVSSETPPHQESSQGVDVNSPGFFSNIYSLFGGNSESELREDVLESSETPDLDVIGEVPLSGPSQNQEPPQIASDAADPSYCNADPISCQRNSLESDSIFTTDQLFAFNPDIFLYLITTAISVVVFLFGYIAFDKSKREGPLVARINQLEKELLIQIKENQIFQDKISGDGTNDRYISNEIVEELKNELRLSQATKSALEEQIQSLEKELENSTEVGLELNHMLSDILSSQNGSDVIKANVEHLQRQLVEQQSTINSANESLALTTTENYELKLQIDLCNKKVFDLQSELDKMCLTVLKIEEEKDQQQNLLENEIVTYKRKYDEVIRKLKSIEDDSSKDLMNLRAKLEQTEHNLELKRNELTLLKDSVKELRAIKNNSEGVLQKLLSSNEIRAELELFKSENLKFNEKLRREVELKVEFEKRAKAAADEAQLLRDKYDEAHRAKVEIQTKLEVLQNYFKDKEAQFQKEISKHESLWVEKQGEATSTTERIKFMQEQLQSFKAQNESLKQEIMSQEVELKSQILVLEKKAHENWVSARQCERKLEDAKQEAAQLRHRLTLRETSHNQQNGEIPLSPLHVDSPASPPLLYGGRDHMTTSPPLSGLPPFLPPPPGVPFIPPPIPGVRPFIPPPPGSMFPGDHRPPPLGRMSSPPINSRYSPSSRGYSPYDDDRNLSSSPSDSEYGTSPPSHHHHDRRGYSPYNDRNRRDFHRPPPPSNVRSNGSRNVKGGISSGSANSNESLEKVNHNRSTQSKV